MASLWPELPSLPLVENSMQGPTDTSNWVVKGLVLCGEYPGKSDDRVHVNTLTTFMRIGITTYVCLQEELELVKLSHFRPYFDDYHKMVAQEGKNMAYFLQFPIEDGGEASNDSELLAFVEGLVGRIKTGEKLYIHCWAGRGRTGIVVACLLGILYSLPAGEALQRTNLYFHHRSICFGDSPEYYPQRMQVFRVLKMHAEKTGSQV